MLISTYYANGGGAGIARSISARSNVASRLNLTR
jgi:hypothetical protein